jgi:transcriptional regulator with XRE-family HTH domain
VNALNMPNATAEHGLTQREAATRLGVSLGTINRRVRDGDLATLPNGRIDPAGLGPSSTLIAEIARGAPRNSIGRTASQARAERDQVLARMAGLDYAERVGQLTATADVEAEQTTIARRFRDALLSLPAQLAPSLINLPDPRQIETALRRHLTRFLDAQAAALHDEPPPP